MGAQELWDAGCARLALRLAQQDWKVELIPQGPRVGTLLEGHEQCLQTLHSEPCEHSLRTPLHPMAGPLVILYENKKQKNKTKDKQTPNQLQDLLYKWGAYTQATDQRWD